jgi:putative transposase
MKNFFQGVRGYLFQGRFSSSVLYEKHLLTAVRYVELNPVHAGMIKYAWEYPWSSAGFHVGEVASDPLVIDRTLLGLIPDWKYFLAGETSGVDTDRFKLAMQTGLPAGDDDFVAKIANLTGRDLSKGKPGRPRKQ